MSWISQLVVSFLTCRIIEDSKLIYSKHISTVKKTDGLVYYKAQLHVTKGLVYRVEFYFPRGSAGLLGVAVYDGGFGVWPSNAGEFFTGDDELISFDDLYLKESAPYIFDIYTYNLDDTYDHVVDVRLGLVSKEAYQARFLPSIAWGEFAEMMSRLLAEQAAKAAAQKEVTAEKEFSWVEA